MIGTLIKQQAFDQLKKVVASAPMLKEVELQLLYILETNATHVAIGAILFNKADLWQLKVKSSVHPTGSDPHMS